ncbi:MAG: type II toxin-antitoxin system RelE/ParE family toxin [Bryobacterales bacterium]|nr:type II toxin-antitoxin system RelE/ParE family toxin [Bryobacterales bacterium]
MKFLWPDSARAELRRIGRETAVRILQALTDYAASGAGDVKALSGEWQGHFRLRVADYRVVFTISPDEITIVRVRHRSDVYR